MRVELGSRAIDGVDQGAKLPLVVRGGDDEVVGERSERGEVEHDHIRCLTVDEDVDEVVCEI